MQLWRGALGEEGAEASRDWFTYAPAKSVAQETGNCLHVCPQALRSAGARGFRLRARSETTAFSLADRPHTPCACFASSGRRFK